MDRTIDYTPLFAEVSRDDVVQYRAELARASTHAAHEHITRVVTWVIAALVIMTMSLVVVFPLLVTVVAIASGARPITESVAALPGLVIVVVAVVLAVRFLRSAQQSWQQRVRMSRFAAANGLIFEPRSPAPSYPGAIFGLGSSRLVTDHFRTPDGRFIDFGNYTYVTGSGKSRTTHRWGFLAMHLDRALPHMLLDSTANNGMFGASNLPTAFRRDQVLSLEGDFDRYFTLYCPKQYERDALYVFTPDLMALLIDEAAPFDVEIIDRWLFVYAARPFPLADPATYQRLLRIVSTVGAKTLSQTDRYVDERIGVFSANIVAPAGQRLKGSVRWAGIIVIGVIVVAWVVPIVFSFLQ
ncbi:MAG: hypothetical protein KIT89_05185 [Microcella sp.]|uniref:hypothetical protein n=1 Tax=Microcella sp. TaxID=1913979 RepID=UPI0024C5BBBD|nr:hypothetical protein [Microcella sp.]UYN84574.1 MAG: hypothetical protein KIT89_05185 [Microcella sp.]